MKHKLISKEERTMRDEYDFSNAVRNPYYSKLKDKKQITININEVILDYFKDMSEKTGIPYQTLINYYLLDCVKNKRTIDISFK